MYRITYDGLTIFDPYGDADEVVSDASMSVEVNASAYLDFTMAMTHPLYDTIRERAGVVTLTWDSTVLFEGIIESIEMDIQGNKSISCVSAMDYLNDTHVRPYSTVAGEADLTAPSSVDGYFQWLIDQHNDHVLDASKMFDVGINQGANLQQNNFIYRSSESEPTTASEITDQILDSLGGYLTMRYEDGRKVLDLYADLHTMNAQIVDFGVNITNFTKTTDTTDQYTAILLHGGSPTFEGGDLEGGDWSHWETHPNTPLVGDKTHGGSVASYFVSGTGEYINDSFFYSRPGRRYKASVYVKNERGSNVTIRGSYQYEQAGGWTTVNVNSSLAVENKDDQWVEFSFDFQPNLSEYTKIRPRWYFDNVGNDGNRRVYLDDFSFSQIEGDTEVSEDPIGLEQVPDGVSSFDADVFKSGDVLYSTSAVERYGYKEEVFEDTTITNIDDLVQAGIKELNKSKEPQITLDIKAVDLALFMEGYTHLNVGDAVRVRSAIHDTDEFLMVNSITLDLQDPGQSEYVIGKAYDSLTGQQSGFLRSLNSGINSSLDAVASLDQTTKDQAIQLGAVENVANQAKDTADNAQNIANNAQNTANSNKEAINSIKDAQTEYEKQLAEMKQGVADAEQEIGQVNERIEGMNSEIESAKSGIEAVRTEAQSNFETAKSAADAAASKADAAQADVDALRSSTSTELQNVKDSVSNVQSDVADALRQASDLAEDLDATKATVEQTVTEFGEVKTTATNAASKADQSLRVSTEASQTATQASQTATSAYEDSQKAITQSSQAVQTANQVSLNLSTNYQTKADADAKYATQASLTATSSQIKAEVSETYATKATVEGLENIANNAVQTWMGSGVPTLSNKPASDWTTAELKAQHSGDIYYDSDTGYSYRFGSSDGKNYSWSLIKDTDISKAIADAAAAQETANEAKSDVTELNTSIPITYATKTELTQTSDSITSRVEEVAQAGATTSNKVSQLEQTASGLQSTVKEQSQKLDQQATTISQVSQRVDSVSSTITQVSGRVDGVEDTADEALSKSSQLSQDLSGFKTSVQQTYETKQDALSKQSQLQQTINGFRTEVSETYTTKDEFNALEIGGTNLIKNSDFSRQGKEWAFGGDGVTAEYDTDATMGTYVKALGSSSGNCRFYQIVKDVWHKGETLVYSFYAKSDDETPPVIDLSRSLIDYGPKHTLSNTWTRYTGSIASTDTPDGGTLSIRFVNAGTQTALITKIKLERGNKATAWSPAPEDFDGKYTSKTEFAQTTESIKATAQSAASNASSALSKVSSLEVSVDGVDAKVEENASDIADAVKTTSQVSQRVDSLTSTITQVSGDVASVNSAVMIQNPGFETGDLTGWTADNWIDPTAEKMAAYQNGIGTYRFRGAAIQGTGNYSYLRSKAIFGAIPGKTYRVSVAALYADSNTTAFMMLRRISDQSRPQITKSIGPNWTSFSGELTVPSNWSIGDDIRFEFAVQGIASGQNRILADDFSIVDISDAKTAQSTANSALSQSSTVQQELTSFKTSVQQTYETKTDALNKQTSLQQSVNNLRTEVSETYTTKETFNTISRDDNLWPNQYFESGKPMIPSKNTPVEDVTPPGGGSAIYLGGRDHFNLNTAFPVTPGHIYRITVDAFLVRGTIVLKAGIWWTKYTSGTAFDMYRSPISSSDLSDGWKHYVYEITALSRKQAGAVFFQLEQSSSGGSTAYYISNLVVQDVTVEKALEEDMLSKDEAETTYSTKSYVDQTARTVSLGVVEEYKDGQHGSALATQSDITAAKDSITQTVSQTYLSKTDATNTYLNKNTAASTYATKTEVKQTSDSLTVTISSAISKAESAQNTANAAKKQTYNTVNASSGTTGYFRFATLKINANYTNQPIYFSLTNRGQKASNVWVQFNNVNSTDPTLNYIQADGGMNVWIHKTATSTWEMIAQKSEGYDTLYVNDYANNNIITVTWVDAFLSSVPSGSTQATRLASKRPSSDIDNAQSTANKANSNAQNAQNRVGNLETCIKMTSNGVRVGKVSNGNFTGYSALVNSEGSFDILDGAGNTCSRFNESAVELGKNNNNSTIDMSNGMVKFYSNHGSNTLNIDTRNSGPIKINGHDLGLLGRSCLLQQSTSKTTAQTGRFVNVPTKASYINTKGQCATTVEPFTQDGDGIRINIKGLYLISLAGVPIDVQPTDILRLSLGTDDQASYIQVQWMAGTAGNMTSHTEMRVLDANKTYHLQYMCDQGGGSNITSGFVTITFMGYLT